MTPRRHAAAFAAPLLLLSVFGAGSREPQLYVSNEIPNTIAVVSARTNAVVATIPVGQRPRGMALSPDKRTVYVALGQDDALGVVDVASGRMTRTIPANRDPALVVRWPQSKRASGSNEGVAAASAFVIARGKTLCSSSVLVDPGAVA